MAARHLGVLLIAALAASVLAACGDDKGKGGAGKAAALDGKRCLQLASACSDEKHADQLAGECVKAAEKLGARGCTAPAVGLYDCYEKKLCGKKDKAWALDDLRVLAERHEVCAAEREALRACVAK